MDNDPVKKLLLETGLSCDDLLKKLQEYKTLEEQRSKDKSKIPSSDISVAPALSNSSKSEELKTTEFLRKQDIIEIKYDSDDDFEVQYLCDGKNEENGKDEMVDLIETSSEVDEDNRLKNNNESELEIQKIPQGIDNESKEFNNTVIPKVVIKSGIAMSPKPTTTNEFVDVSQKQNFQFQKSIKINRSVHVVHSNNNKEDEKLDTEEAAVDKGGNETVFLSSKYEQRNSNTKAKIRKAEDCELLVETDSEQKCKYDGNNEVESGNKINEIEVHPDSEKIRNNLKMQLNSLRNRKKTNFIKPTIELREEDCTKKNVIEQSSFSPIIITPIFTKEKNIEQNLCTPSTRNKVTETYNPATITPIGINKEKKLNQDLYTQTNELGLKILSVKGGVDYDTEESRKPPIKENTSNISHALVELRKIIRKDRAQRKPNNEASNKILPTQQFIKVRNENEINKLVTLDMVSGHENDKSPFLSNSLDEFLTENAKLNISYNVPKSGAEKGLREGDKKNSNLSLFPSPLAPLMKTPPIDTDEIHNKPTKEFVTIKAKTLAEKRKLLQQSGLLKSSVKKIEAYTKLGEKRKVLQPSRILKKTTINNKLLDELKEFPRDAAYFNYIKNSKFTKINKQKMKMNSFIMFNNQKIWLPTKSKQGNCLGKIPDSGKNESKYEDECLLKKPSLLNDLKAINHLSKIKYKPGPLCKKSSLQVLSGKCSDVKWITEIRKMPQISLEVIPELMKPIPFNLLHLLPPNNGKYLTEEFVDFALTALVNTKKKSSKIFNLPVQYANNENHMIVRIDKSNVLKTENMKIDNEVLLSNITQTVSFVLNDLLNYLEIKDIEEKLVKEDPDFDSKIPNEAVRKVKKRKKSKVNLELRRLSCKVINVEVDEANGVDEDGPCPNLHCRLGCICDSLACDKLISYHCKRVECMLSCSCSKTLPPVNFGGDKKQLVLPSGTNIFSTDTVNRLDDQAKRNLAKVEKEFTQTVIQSKNMNIVVGGKLRRIKKMPKKYSDFIENITPFIEYSNDKSIEEPDENNKKRWIVSLPRLPLNDVVPFCMLHQKYNCICTVKDPRFSNENKLYANKNGKCQKLHFNEDKEKAARTSPVSDKYTLRNQCAEYHKNLKEKVKYYPYNEKLINQSLQTIENSADELRQMIYKDTTTLPIVTEPKEVPVSIDEIKRVRPKKYIKKTFDNASANSNIPCVIKPLEKNSTNSRKRKQSFDYVRNDFVEIQSSVTNQDLTKVIFEGETVVDNSYGELIKKIGAESWQNHARLLPWKSLLNGFYSGRIKIWCLPDQPSRLLMNESEKNPPKRYINILDCQKESDVIGWIKTKQLPSIYNEINLSFILKPTKNHFEIVGVCTKTITPKTEDLSTKTEAVQSLLIHKEKNDEEQVITLRKKQLGLINLIQDTRYFDKANDIIVNESIWAPLPLLQDQLVKWRMIKFAPTQTDHFVEFQYSNYTIASKDLIKAAVYAQKQRKTIVLKNDKLSRNDKSFHPSFGIYVTPCRSIFIGPYLYNTKKHYLCTYPKTSCWMVPVEKKYFEEVIDLTNDNEHTSESPPRESVLKKHQSKLLNLTGCDSKLNLIQSDPIEPKDFNRFIVTNIPHFGYLGGMQHDDSSTFDIGWPLENKRLRFENVDAAQKFLEFQLSSQLLSFPTNSFKIKTTVRNWINLDIIHPMDVKYFNGNSICGDFGVLNLEMINDTMAMEYFNMSKCELIAKVQTRRNELLLHRQIRSIAEKLNYLNEKDVIEKEDDENVFLKFIVQKVKAEKVELTKKTNVLGKEIKRLLKQRREMAHRICNLISNLSKNEQSVHGTNLMDILKIGNAKTNRLPDEIKKKIENNQTAINLKRKGKNIKTLSMRPILTSVLKPGLKTAKVFKLNVPTTSPRIVPRNSTTNTLTAPKSISHKSKLPIFRNIIIPPSKDASPSSTVINRGILDGYKIVKIHNGKLMLVKDNKQVKL